MVTQQMTALIDTGQPAAKRGWRKVSRGRAFITHLCVSAAIVAVVCMLIFFVWYPHPYFKAAGAWNVLRILISVDLVVGPLLTLIVFKPGKRGLKFDLCVIALMQVSALGYGVSVVYRERPYFTVFAVDRFYVLARQDVDQAQLADPALTGAAKLGAKPAVGPLLTVATRPADQAGMQRLMDETVFGNQPDIERRPEFWSAYPGQTQQVLARARPLAALKAQRPGSVETIDRLVAALGRSEDTLVFLPLIARNSDMSMIIDAANGMPLEVLDVDPWPGGPPPSEE